MLITKIKTWNRKHRGVTFASEMLACLLLFALMAVSSELEAGDSKVYVTTRSVHYLNNDRYNNNNWGFIFEHQQHGGQAYTISLFRNSFGDLAGAVGMRLASLYQDSNVNVSLVGGVVVGYRHNPVFPMAGLTIDMGRSRLTVSPTVTNLSFKIGEW